jgi:pyruvate kinase
MGAISLSF